MKIVALMSQKGGAGKTTLAVGLAVAAARDGRSVALIDTDPQASAAAWSDLRNKPHPSVVAAPTSRLPQALRAAESAGADIVFVDTAPHAGGEIVSAARAADLILIPCRPALFDIKAIGATADVAQLAGRPAVVVVNAAPPRGTRIIEDARQAVAGHKLPVCEVVVSQRSAFAHALTLGLSAQEFEPNGRAAEEIGRLYAWIRGERK